MIHTVYTHTLLASPTPAHTLMVAYAYMLTSPYMNVILDSPFPRFLSPEGQAVGFRP